ncbi:MAG: hypothetical protein JRD04_01685 [Deltaproteobacteria bacterium]|nr:hypothetical protein [Deltaproteobacteria bacterium]
MEHIEHQISKVKAGLEILSHTIDGSLTEVKAHMDSVGHILAEYTHDRKMESIGLMAGGVAHDFKNFIHIIAVNAGSIKDSTENARNVRRCRQITAVCRKASDLVEHMMNLTETGELPTKKVDLNVEVKKGVTLLQDALPERIRLETVFSEDMSSIAGDPTQICQVISNLVNNGREAIEGEGVISITTGEVILEACDCLKHGNARPGEFAVLTVSDSGPGIPPEILPKIYDPFVSGKKGNGNAGFGLAIVYTIVRRHNGWIDVESKEGMGARFSVYFPIAQGESE